LSRFSAKSAAQGASGGDLEIDSAVDGDRTAAGSRSTDPPRTAAGRADNRGAGDRGPDDTVRQAASSSRDGLRPAVFKAPAAPGAVFTLAVMVVSVSAVEPEVAEAFVADAEIVPSRGSAAMSIARFTARAFGPLIALNLTLGFATDHWPLARAAAAVKQSSFASPEEVLNAVIEDLKSDNIPGLVEIFGPRIEPILNSGDPVEDKNARDRFLASAEETRHFDGSGDTLTLVIGKDDWPFPIPLKKSDNNWRFDTAAGQAEILNRRIGENELSTIQRMLAYVDAQGDYAQLQRQHSGTPEYAQHILSSPSKMDGLYWPTAEGQPPSPLGPLVASVRVAGYRAMKGEGPTPYHGYFFKVLTSQGPSAPSGAADFIVKGRMIGSFGLVA
jgi:Protein of unknown function (DUF2950)